MILAVGLALPATRLLAAGPPINSVADVKAAFDQAMGKALAERVPLLEALEEGIDQAIFDGTLTGKDHKGKAQGLYYKFHTQLQLAKYLQAKQTYATYIGSLRDSKGKAKALAVFQANVARWARQRNLVQCVSICETMAKEFAQEIVKDLVRDGVKAVIISST